MHRDPERCYYSPEAEHRMRGHATQVGVVAGSFLSFTEMLKTMAFELAKLKGRALVEGATEKEIDDLCNVAVAAFKMTLMDRGIRITGLEP